MITDSIFTTEMLTLRIIYFIIIVAAASGIAKIIATGISRYGKRAGTPENTTRRINGIITFFIALAGIVLILYVFRFNVNAFIAGVEITGLRISHSLRLLLIDGTGVIIERILYVVIIIAAASLIAKTIATGISRFGKRSGLPENITRLMNKTITYFIAFVGLVLVLDIFKFNINTFIASFGIVGLIIGLSSQAIISNFIAGILIMLEKPFYRGDVIDVAGFQGRVEDISIRSTRVKTLDGRMITVPNSTFTTSSVVNYSKIGRMQVRIPVTFPPDVDLVKISEIMISVAENIEKIRPYHTEVLVTGMTLSGLQKNIGVELRFWIDRFIERDRVVSKVMSRIKEEFIKEKIIMATPPS